MARLDQLGDSETRVPSARRSENLHVLVAGGTTMPFAAILTGFGYLGGMGESDRYTHAWLDK